MAKGHITFDSLFDVIVSMPDIYTKFVERDLSASREASENSEQTNDPNLSEKGREALTDSGSGENSHHTFCTTCGT